MQDDRQNQGGQQTDQQQASVEQPAPPQGSILNQTFGDVLQNKEAQERIMKAMHIGPEQFQKLLKSTEGNPLTGMTVGQLFNSGFVQKAVQAQGGRMPEAVQPDQLPGEVVGSQEGSEIDPEQFQQMVSSGNAQVLETDEMGNPTKIAVQQPQSQQEPQNQSFWDIIKGIFKS